MTTQRYEALAIHLAALLSLGVQCSLNSVFFTARIDEGVISAICSVMLATAVALITWSVIKAGHQLAKRKDYANVSVLFMFVAELLAIIMFAV
jgi:hypothetical protein